MSNFHSHPGCTVDPSVCARCQVHGERRCRGGRGGQLPQGRAAGSAQTRATPIHAGMTCELEHLGQALRELQRTLPLWRWRLNQLRRRPRALCQLQGM